MKKIDLNGMRIPQIWFKNIQYITEKGTKKSYILSILILSEVVYLYNQSLKNFDGVEKTYQEYADLFGSTKIAVKAAIDFLVRQKLIKREFRDIIMSVDGQKRKIKLTNIMFLYPISKNIINISSLDYKTDLKPKRTDNTAFVRINKNITITNLEQK